MLDKWIDNLILASKGERELVCPYCGSGNIGYKETVFDTEDNIGYADMWCIDCKKAVHISRGTFINPISFGGDIPIDLTYDCY
jgi:hypothetical protein